MATFRTASEGYVDAAVGGLVKADIGLGNVDDTSDANKPVSTAQQTAIDLKENSGGLPIKDTTISAAQTISATQQCVTFGPITVNALVTVNGPWIALTQLKGI